MKPKRFSNRLYRKNLKKYVESILLEALNNKITITATNLESAIIIDRRGYSP